MILRWLKSSPRFRKLYTSGPGRRWTQNKVARFIGYLNPGEQVIDIGSGNGLICALLRTKGLQVLPVDIADLSYASESRPQLFDGEHLPFDNNHFDVALLLTVLHHAEDPKALLEDACRVATKIIIMEDIYGNRIQQRLTYAIDWAINLGHSPLPYNHKSDAEWRKLFEQLGCRLTHQYSYRVLGIFRQAVYVLQR